MRLLTRILLLSILALLASAALVAQHAGFGGVHGGSPGISPGGGHALPAPRVGTAPLGLRGPAASYTGIRPGALRSTGTLRSYGRARDFRRVPYAYFFAPYYYPFLDYTNSAYSDYGYGYDMAADPTAQGALMAQSMLGEQINRLSAELDQMRYAQQFQAPPPPGPAEQDPQPPSAPVTLVLRNGQQLKVQNYAVMDKTFWDFSSQTTRKIPIANIDVAASAKATIASGGEFPQLESGGEQ
jgi:hypothetical protein